jgi:ASC-1-like (ASCH) protein
MVDASITIILRKPIQNRVNTPYLDRIKYGDKQFEGRLLTKFKEWKLMIGKQMIFYDQDHHDSWVLIKITSLLIFPDFGVAFDTLGSKLIPGKNKSEVITIYNDLFHYDIEKIIQGETSKMINDIGVVAIGFDILDMN